MHGRADDGCNMQASYSQVTLQRDALSARISGKRSDMMRFPATFCCKNRPTLCFYTTRFWGTDGLRVLPSAGYKCIFSLYFPLVFAKYCMCYVIIAGQLISPHVLALFCFTSYRLNHVLSIGIKHTTAASYLSSCRFRTTAHPVSVKTCRATFQKLS